MSKGNSGFYKGTGSTASGFSAQVIKNATALNRGDISPAVIERSKKQLYDMSAHDYFDALQYMGADPHIRPSNRGSKTTINIDIDKQKGTLSHIKLHKTPTSHGSPYVEFSMSTKEQNSKFSKIKIVADRKAYDPRGEKKTYLIFLDD